MYHLTAICKSRWRPHSQHRLPCQVIHTVMPTPPFGMYVRMHNLWYLLNESREQSTSCSLLVQNYKQTSCLICGNFIRSCLKMLHYKRSQVPALVNDRLYCLDQTKRSMILSKVCEGTRLIKAKVLILTTGHCRNSVVYGIFCVLQYVFASLIVNSC